MVLDEGLVLLLLLFLKAGVEQLVVDVLPMVVLLQHVAAGLLLLLWAAIFLHVSVSSSELRGIALVALVAVEIRSTSDACVPFQVGVTRLL